MSRRARRARWADRVTKAFAGALVLSIAGWGVSRMGLLQPPPIDIATLDDAASQVKKNDPIGTRVAVQAAAHIPDAQRARYDTSPPNSGPHWGAPATWGIKDSSVPDERAVHNLEHGGVLIVHRDLTPEEESKVRSLVRGLNSAGYGKIILAPSAGLGDAKVAASSWGWVLKLPALDERALVAFVRAHHEGSDAPEPNAR